MEHCGCRFVFQCTLAPSSCLVKSVLIKSAEKSWLVCFQLYVHQVRVVLDFFFLDHILHRLQWDLCPPTGFSFTLLLAECEAFYWLLRVLLVVLEIVKDDLSGSSLPIHHSLLVLQLLCDRSQNNPHLYRV